MLHRDLHTAAEISEFFLLQTERQRSMKKDALQRHPPLLCPKSNVSLIFRWKCTWKRKWQGWGVQGTEVIFSKSLVNNSIRTPFTFGILCRKRLQNSCTRSMEMLSTATTSCSSSGVWNIARAGSWDFFSWKYDSTRSLLCKLLSNRIKRICEGNKERKHEKNRCWDREQIPKQWSYED